MKRLVPFVLAAAAQCSFAQSAAPAPLSADLREVSNAAAFQRSIRLSPEHLAKLRTQYFVVSPTDQRELFWRYAENDYRNLPSIVTVDATLNLYHVFFEGVLRVTEQERLLPITERLTAGMLRGAKADLAGAKDAEVRAAAARNAAYFGVATRLLGKDPKLSGEAATMVEAELKLIAAHRGPEVGSIFGFKIDYSQFQVRGHYTKTPALGRYFKAMMWYGLVPMPVARQDGFEWVLDPRSMRMAALMVSTLHREGLLTDWERVYEPTSFFVGASNALTPGEFQKLLTRAVGPVKRADDLAGRAKMQALLAELVKARRARIVSRAGDGNQPGADLQFRFMGQRYIPDSEILQRLTGEDRPIPSGLDVMAVFGSEQARMHLDRRPAQYNPKGWAEYLPERAKLTEEFAKVPEAMWASNLYWSKLNAIRALLVSKSASGPAFMRTPAYADRMLSTALCGWAALRHDTILYGTQSVAEMGDGEEDQPYVRGYVEPNQTYYDRLLALVRQSRQGLRARNLLTTETGNNFADFEKLVVFLRNCVQKQTANKPLTRDEHYRIRKIEGELGMLNLSMKLAGTGYQTLSQDDTGMMLVADVHTGGSQALHVGIGLADDLLAVVPIEGKLTLARGTVMSYYEFLQPISQRLTDQAWAKLVEAGKAPPRPHWIESFFVPTKAPHRNDP